MDRHTPDNSLSGCPGRVALLGFNSGGLPDEELEVVALHLSTCQDCASVYRDIVRGSTGDFLDEVLRGPAKVDWRTDSPGYQAMEAAALAIRFDAVGKNSTTAPVAKQPASKLPDIIGPYVIRGLLGAGGMGKVYDAVHPVIGRPVAVKMLQDSTLERPDSLIRFRTEAAAIARLRHPNVVEVIHFDEWEGLPYLVMEKVEGKTLSRVLVARGGRLPPREAAELLRQLADTVEYAHGKKVLHRDLKPGNVMIVDAERGTRNAESKPANGSSLDPAIGDRRSAIPKITDFGLAKILDEGHCGLTDVDTVLGTPSYMAPEQARGATAAVGPAADVYSLGAILYECLTGRPPFRAGNKNATLHLVLRGALKPPKEYDPDVPAVLEAICLKCLEKEPANRYQSAGELAADLGRWLDNKATRVRPPGWFQRNHRRLASAVVIGLALTGGGVAAVTYDPVGRRDRVGPDRRWSRRGDI